jgi:uncharacterized membrane protein YkvA (DUF1232 family)
MSTPRLSIFALTGRSAVARFFLFRTEAATLWRALWHPDTPLYLKGATILATLYLVSPIDLIPDFIPLAGWIDDLILVPLLVGWIVKMLPAHVAARPVRATVRRR